MTPTAAAPHGGGGASTEAAGSGVHSCGCGHGHVASAAVVGEGDAALVDARSGAHCWSPGRERAVVGGGYGHGCTHSGRGEPRQRLWQLQGHS